MANTITTAEKFMPILDEIYKRESLTARLDSPTKPLDFGGVGQVNIFKTTMTGLGTYSRSSGYPAGDVTAEWEAITLSCERGRAFSVDNMDNEETLGQAFGRLAGEFIRTQVVPEVDAYRFAEYASTAGVDGTAAALADAAATIAAIDVGQAAMDENEVPKEGRLIFIDGAHDRLLRGAVTRVLESSNSYDRRLNSLDGTEIISVPSARFAETCTLDAGATSGSGGFTLAGSQINFIILHPSAIGQATKLAKLKIFSPEMNQLSDAWLLQYRLYHDVWVYDNKVDGVYVHTVS